MCKSLVVAMIKPLHKLFEKVSGSWLIKPPRHCYNIEKLSSCSELKDNVVYLLLLTASFQILCMPHLNQLDHMLVLNF